MKRYYICNGCATKHEFECSQDFLEGLIVAFCPGCGKMKEFMMINAGEEAGLDEEMKMLAPEEIKVVMIMLIAIIIAAVGCYLPVSWTTGVTIILPIQLVILITLTLQAIRITLKEDFFSSS